MRAAIFTVGILMLLAGLFFIVMAYVVVLGFQGSESSLANSEAPLSTLANSLGFGGLGISIDVGILLSFFSCTLASINSTARILFAMARHGLIPDGSILRLARIVGLGRAKELTLLNDHVTPAAALAMGLVNWVVEPGAVDATLAGIVEKAFHSSRTATGHAKRLLHASFHRDPRELIEDVVRAQNECMGSWEMDEANRAWDERREARFYPPPPGPRRP